MIATRNNPASSNRQVSAEALLRDVAFVLRMTRKVKSEMMSERATTVSMESETYSRPEPDVCAV